MPFLVLSKIRLIFQNDLESLQNEDPTTVPVAYTLERLIRGLASDRKTSIQGFFVSLVELLRQHVKVSKNVSVDQIFETVDKVLHIKGTQGVSWHTLKNPPNVSNA